jgi:ABC-type lipoprotein export system ATPase subunit
VTHDLAAAALADRQIRLKDGQVASDRTRDYGYSEIGDAEKAISEKSDNDPVEPTEAQRKLLN